MGVYSSNRTWLNENYSYDSINNPNSILDCLIETERSDMNIFESVIDHDFQEAYCEAGIMYMTEEEKEDKESSKETGIIATIKRIIRQIIDAITGFFSKFKKKVKEISDKDKELYDKYSAAIKKEGVGKTLKSKIDLNTLKDVNINDMFEGEWYDDIVKTINQYAQMCQVSKDSNGNKVEVTADFEGLLKKINNKLDENEKNFNEIFKEYDNESELKVDQSFITTIENNLKIGESKAMNTLTDGYNKAKSALEDLEKKVNLRAGAGGVGGDEEWGVLSTVSKGIKDTFKPLERMFKMEGNEIVKLYKTFRSLYTQLGELCTSKESSKEAETSGETPVAVAAAAMLSDMYVDEAFAF